ncbi:MAG: LysR family transcriptional regulator, partial [Gammaproteobacteria bacterium]
SLGAVLYRKGHMKKFGVHKHSTCYAVQKIKSQLGIKAFGIQRRKAILTPNGQMLYRRVCALADEANQ